MHGPSGRAGRTEERSLPAHLSALSRNSREICSFLPSKAAASPSAFINAPLCSPGGLPPHPPSTHTSQPFLPRRGLAQLISGQMSRRRGRDTFQVLRPKQQIRPDMCRCCSARGGVGAAANTMVRGPLNLGLSCSGAHFLCQLVLTDHRHELGSSPLTIWDVSCDREGAVGLQSLA